jgi:23S rRNA (pseudouridine1915-N3)-methyltransferase
MKITVIGVGKIKEKYWNMAIDEYAKRLSRYCRLELVEVADEKTPDEAGEALETQIKDREGQRILDKIPEGAYVVALAIEGVMLDSVALSKKLEDIALRGSSHIVFIIGGSLGLSKKVLQRADDLLSFSRMTFPHQMMRVVLLEQIYRSFRISSHEPYHK